MKIVEFTINIGGYDKPRTDLININNCDIFRNNARNSRCIKILAHKYIDADFSIYYDSNKRKNTTLTNEEIIDKYLGDGDICVTYRRGTKSCVYDEIERAKRRINDPGELQIINEQYEHYRSIGIPENIGVCGYQPLIRRHSQMMNEFNEAWWAEMCRWSYRDQVCFPVVLLQFPKLKVREVELSEIMEKLYPHAHSYYPTINP